MVQNPVTVIFMPMAATQLPEHWLRGAVPAISPFLQPVAHALLQAKDEVTNLLEDFPDSLLWERPGGTASPGFHLQHLAGVLDRLFTYAEGRQLSPEQLTLLKAEGVAVEGLTTAQLVAQFRQQVDQSLEKLTEIAEDRLTDARGVGRAQLPSTVLGLLFHAAEHTMRHTGQLLVTVKILKSRQRSSPG
jgi:uncharacterized damage-inducible protein DinB